jgi:hypothetical protein
VELAVPVQHSARPIGALWRHDYLPTPAAARWQSILQQVGGSLHG